MQKRSTRRSLKLWGLIFVAWFFVFILLLLGFGVDNTFKILSNLNPLFLAGAVLSFSIAITISMLDWAFLLAVLKEKVKLRILSRVLLAGLFVDNVLPNIAPGGEITMGYLLNKKTKIPLSKTFASIVVYMMSWFFGFVFFSTVVLLTLLLTNNIELGTAILTAVLLIPFTILFLVILYLAINAKACERVVVYSVRKLFKYVLRFSRFKGMEAGVIKWIRKTIKSFNKVFVTHFRDKRVVFFSGLLMSIHHFMFASSFYFVILAFGGKISFIVAAGIFITISLISLLSLIPGQLGVYENPFHLIPDPYRGPCERDSCHQRCEAYSVLEYNIHRRFLRDTARAGDYQI